MTDSRPARERIAEYLRGEVTRRTFRPPVSLSGGGEVALWTRNTWASQEVVGERAHVDVLRALLGTAHQTDGGEHRFTATLHLEPSNPVDGNAVAVHIDGQRVGYLPRADAPRYRPVLDAIHASGRTPAVVARIWAADFTDWDDDAESTTTRFGAGVQLALDEPHLLLPVNSPPSEPHALLPQGAAIQVHDTAAHLEQLAAALTGHGERWVLATLRHVEEHLARSTRDIVEVRVDGARIGKLTPKMSGDLLPAVRFLTERGQVTVARMLVAGNRAAVTTTLYVVRAHQLDDDWFDRVPAL